MNKNTASKKSASKGTKVHEINISEPLQAAIPTKRLELYFSIDDLQFKNRPIPEKVIEATKF